MEVQREKDSLGYYEIQLIKGESTLTICFGGNGDLYWKLLNMDDLDSNDEFFTIDSNDGTIYDLFYKLYMQISLHQIYQVSEVEKAYCRSKEDVMKLHERKRKYNEELFSHPYFKDLCNGKYIEWHSDNEPFEIGNRLILFLDEESEKITLEINKVNRVYDFLAVSFSHSGSRYSPFDLAFYDHYTELCEMDLGKLQGSDSETPKKLIKE